MAQPRPNLQSVSAFCGDQDYQFILTEALRSRTLDRSTVEALRETFGLKNLENTRRKWLLRSMYLSVWHYICTLQAQGKNSAVIAQDLTERTGLPYSARMIGEYTKEGFFKSLHEGTISTIPIVPSPNSGGATSAADPTMSSVNEEEEEDHDNTTVWMPHGAAQHQAWHLSNSNFNYMSDRAMSLENEVDLALPDACAMQLGAEPCFTNRQFPVVMQPQNIMYPGVYYQDIAHQQVFNHQDVGEPYDFQDTHEETQDDLFGIDPQLFNP